MGGMAERTGRIGDADGAEEETGDIDDLLSAVDAGPQDDGTDGTDAGGDGADGGRPGGRRHVRPIVLVLVAAFVAGAVFAGGMVWRQASQRHRERLDAALSDCRAAAGRYESAASAYRATVDAAADLVSQARDLGLDDTMESYSDLRRLTTQDAGLGDRTVACRASLGIDRLDALASRAAADGSHMTDLTRDLQYGAENLRGVVQSAQSSVSRDRLDALVSRGRLALERSAGKAPERLRTALSQAADAARHTLDTTPTGAPASAYEGSAAGLQSALDAVIDAMPTDCRLVDCVALTFDDGPDGKVTPRVLDALRQGGARATFFLQGRFVSGSNVALARRMADEGHSVGSISWRHTRMHDMPAGQLRTWFADTDRVISRATGRPVTLFRPPDGAWSDALAAQARASGQAMILWGVDSRDWKTRKPDAIRRQVLDHAYPGAIVDLHDGNAATARALPGIIAGLTTRGYRLVTVDTLLDGDLRPGEVFYGLGDTAS